MEVREISDRKLTINMNHTGNQFYIDKCRWISVSDKLMFQIVHLLSSQDSHPGQTVKLLEETDQIIV